MPWCTALAPAGPGVAAAAARPPNDGNELLSRKPCPHRVLGKFGSALPRTPPAPVETCNRRPQTGHQHRGGAAPRPAEEARAFRKWIDEFEVALRTRNRFATEKLRNPAQEQIEAARLVYAKIIRDAK